MNAREILTSTDLSELTDEKIWNTIDAALHTAMIEGAIKMQLAAAKCPSSRDRTPTQTSAKILSLKPEEVCRE